MIQGGRGAGIQVVEQTIPIQWHLRCRRLPQATVTQDLLDHLALRESKGRFALLSKVAQDRQAPPFIALSLQGIVQWETV
jgi:hypothetical protein